jgi:hypothetical protein
VAILERPAGFALAAANDLDAMGFALVVTLGDQAPLASATKDHLSIVQRCSTGEAST